MVCRGSGAWREAEEADGEGERESVLEDEEVVVPTDQGRAVGAKV